MKIKILRLIKMVSKFTIYGILIQTISLSVLLASNGIAQNKSVKEVYIEVESSYGSLDDVFEMIETQSNYRFAYSKDNIPNSGDLEIRGGERNVYDVLIEVSQKRKLKFTQINNSISVEKIRQKDISDLGVVEIEQAITVSGKVTSSDDGEGLPGVNVIVKGSGQGTVTDVEGNYGLDVPSEGSILVFSSVGFISQEIAVGTQSVININLSADVTALDEIVVVGYGEQKRSSITGAISKMDAKEVEDIPVPFLSNSLAGRISGVYVTQASGVPGYAADIRVRSVNTWKSSGNEPLYVIDGVISDKSSFDILDYYEVESITVLKDAASGAIYGARAANGVILVTTKTGKSGKVKLDYNYSYSFDHPSKLTDYQSAGESIIYNNLARTVAGQAPFADDQEVAYYQEHDYALDYFDKAYNDPVMQKHSLTGSGGTENIRYFVGASYFDQSGYIKTTGYDKFNIRTNLDIDITDNLSATFKFAYNEGATSRFSFQEDMSSTFEPNATGGSLMGRLLYYLPYSRPQSSDGHFLNPGWIGNPLAFVEEGDTNKANDQNADMLIRLNYKIPAVEGLSAAAMFSRNTTLENIKHYEIKPTVYDVVREGSHGLIYTDEIIGSRKTSYPSKEKLGQEQNSNKSYQLNLSTNYVNSFGKHNVDALLVYEQSEGLENNFYGVRENFPLFQKDQFWASGSSRADSYVNGSDYEYGRASFIGRLSYNYGDTYFLNATIRRDGSMLFAPDYRWGSFPSVSAGWILSNESFMRDGFFNFLKLRASYGLAGNDAVGGWKWQETYRTNGTVMIGATPVPRVVYNGIVNEELTWEKTKEFNIGLDSRFLDGFILNMEYYYRHNYDILDSRIVSLPASFGGSMPPVNYGVVDGHGFELEAGYNGSAGSGSAFNYEVRGSFSYAGNKVIERDVAENVRDVDNPLGRSTDYVKALVSKGIMRTQADLDALPNGYTIYGRQPALGAINFEDVNGLEAGVPDGKIDNYDRQVISGKHYLPPYTFGLNLSADWKGIGINVFFQGSMGVSKMYNDGYGRRFADGGRAPQFWSDSWTQDNINAEYPQAVPWDYTMDHQESTFWLKSGDYFRLQNLNLNYSLPKHVVQKLGMTNIRFLVTGSNLLTFTSFDYYDPTVAETRSYPTMRSITLGVNVTF